MNEESVVGKNGVTVTKSFSSDEFPVPAVTFEVQSNREEPVDLRISDVIPEGFGVEQIGFHPDYGSEHWTATGNGEVKFERTIEAEEKFTTVYGVRMEESDEPDMFLRKPTVAVNPTDTIETEEVVPEESSSVVRELARGERKSVPGLDSEEPDEPATEDTPETDEPLAALADETQGKADDETEESDEAVAETAADDEQVDAEPAEEGEEDEQPVVELGAEPDVADYEEGIDSEEPVVADYEDIVESETAPAESVQSADSPTDGSMNPQTDTDSIVAAFAAEIDAGNVAEDDLAVIKDAVVDEPESDRVRVEHLQTRVSDLEAYSDALEAFIDENGTAQELLADLTADIETVETEMERVEERLDAAADERDTMSEHLESLEDTVEAVAGVAERIERVSGDIEALDERVEDVEETTMELEAVAEELDSVKADLEELTAWRDQLSDVF